MSLSRLLSFLLLLSFPFITEAQQGLDAITVTTNSDGGQSYVLSIQLLILMTILSFLPAILIMMTSFTRIVIVLSIMRQATGLMQAPSAQIIIGLSLFLTFFIMAPVFDRITEQALTPYFEDEIDMNTALTRAVVPLREFMLNQTREHELKFFIDLSAEEGINSVEDVPLKVVIPAFITSELKTAFAIGFLIFIPFLVIDLVVASVLMSMGMMMLSPMIISLPFKLMLFVLVDGWTLIIGTLAGSYYVP
ncbi:MAG: flagellar type III secretion system pore protein FliP [Gammaproteobacteria bacterium]|nr:flagellar type III secretion system pore protein FliP [Gammaproteobacteria bacterium]